MWQQYGYGRKHAERVVDHYLHANNTLNYTLHEIGRTLVQSPWGPLLISLGVGCALAVPLGLVELMRAIQGYRRLQEESSNIRVELDALSGLPNPSWALTLADTVELRQRLTTLRHVTQPPSQKHLGYRGFLVSNPKQVKGLPTVMRVFCGTVTCVSNTYGTSYVDSIGMEAWLLQQARQHGYGDIVDGLLRTSCVTLAP